MLPSETMIWQPEFTDKTLSRKPGAVQFAGFRVIRPCKQTSFFSKIFCLSVDSPARQRALLVTTGYLTVTVV
ncbi:hypothetical protein EWM66_11325 [Escherichia coli O157:H7]|nr:hypothetical protein EWM66_11325 [Escherichia coli O157:H7]